MISKQSISIIGIMAATKDGVIGRNNALPWYYLDEIKHFRAITC
ncbi:dihydrofolate reductase [Candidatus Tisiphia endosymbiont of Nedyus quadrimaculatus]